MKFIAPILAIIVALGAAYFSFEHSAKFEDVQKSRLDNLDNNRRITATADVADKNIVDERALLATSKDNLELATQSVIALEATSNQLKNESAKLDRDIAAQDVEFAALNAALAEVNAILEDLGEEIDIEGLPGRIKEIEDNLLAQREKNSELTALIQGANNSLATKRAEVSRLVDRKQTRNQRIARNSMEAVVTAVDQDWGILVIGAGSNSGFTPQTKLLVKRDGRLIGRVTPSSIEQTQTIAEIDFKSLAPGVRIQPGDRVMLAAPATN